MATTRPLPRQRGVAVITAMMIVAIGTIIAVAIASRQQFDLQREQNEALMQQARSLGVSGERFAAAVLYRDRQTGDRNNSDSFDDDWAQSIPPVPIDNAALQGCVFDLQGRFNLNNLINAEGQAQPVYVEQFKRLLAELAIETAKADAVLDWLDADVDPVVPNGAEDDWYTSLETAYRAANRAFSSISELKLVKGFDMMVEEERKAYEALLPHVTVLPISGGPTALNVNTATPEVLASIDELMPPLATTLSRWDTAAYEDYPDCADPLDLEAEEAGVSVLEDRDMSPWENIDDFRADAGVDAEEEFAPGIELSVESRFFQVRIDIATDGILLSQYTLFERNAQGQTRVLGRTRDAL